MELKPTKLKIKSQSPPTRCEICHKTDCFDPNTGSCSRCGVLVRWQDSLPVNDNIVVPIGVSVERYENQLKLVQGWYNRKTVKFLIPFTLTWNGALALFWVLIPTYIIDSIMNNGNFFSLLTLFFLLPHTLVGLLYIYYLIATYKNITTILVDHKSLNIEHHPLPWLGKRTISTTDVTQLYLKKAKGWSVNDEVTYIYELRAKLKNNKDIKLIGGLISEEVGHFLEQQIENYLGIVDEPIQGEVPK